MRALRLCSFACLLTVFAGCSSTHTSEDDAGDGADAGDFAACAVPSDCVLLSESCCGACGAATREDSIAVRADRAADYRRTTCGDPIECPACFMEQDPTIVATCEAGRCVVVDLQTRPATACTATSECRLRANECCECGASVTPRNVLAVSDPADIETLLCDPGTGCPECAPVYPDSVSAACVGGRCVVEGR